jgi:hypothetical protein
MERTKQAQQKADETERNRPPIEQSCAIYTRTRVFMQAFCLDYKDITIVVSNNII